MRKCSYYQEIIAVLMIYLVLLLFPGCVTYRNIPRSNLPDTGLYYYEIHAGDTNYKIENTWFDSGILKGKIVEMSALPQKIKIFLSSDSVITISQDKILSTARLLRVESMQRLLHKVRQYSRPIYPIYPSYR